MTIVCLYIVCMTSIIMYDKRIIVRMTKEMYDKLLTIDKSVSIAIRECIMSYKSVIQVVPDTNSNQSVPTTHISEEERTVLESI